MLAGATWGFCGGEKQIVVASDGSGMFRSIQAAVNSLGPQDHAPVRILIRNGLYPEQVFIRRSNIALIGEDRDSTRIVFPVLRSAWRAAHSESDRGSGVVNIDTATADITLANLTICNNHGSLYGTYNQHQFAVRGAGTRIILVRCAILSDGGDALSLWDREDGMYYHGDCTFEGWVDFVCPRGSCYIKDSKFFGHNVASASLWHDGSAARNQRFVIVNSTFDGRSGFPLGRNHLDGQFFLLHCRFSANMADRPFFRPPSSPAPWKWGDRHYFFDCHRDGGDYPWFADNLSAAEGSPLPEQITAPWTFDNKWDPEASLSSILPMASMPAPYDGATSVSTAAGLTWIPGGAPQTYLVSIDSSSALKSKPYQVSTASCHVTLRSGTTYYWRVDEISGRDTVRGPVWRFITK